MRYDTPKMGVEIRLLSQCKSTTILTVPRPNAAARPLPDVHLPSPPCSRRHSWHHTSVPENSHWYGTHHPSTGERWQLVL